MELLIERYRKLLDRIPLTFVRSLDQKINWQARSVCILGARGTGKSTLMLQHIKKDLPIEETLYLSLDDLYFKQHTLTEVIDSFQKEGGKYLFLDEVHKYNDWQREVKNSYDFNPDLQIVVSGSSFLALQKSEVDLSRRMLRYELPELSFREYLVLKKDFVLPIIPLGRILTDHEKIVHDLASKISYPLKDFHDYLTYGAYPFFLEGENEYLIRINQLINLIIDYDLPEAKPLETSTLNKLKQLLYVLSTIVPFKPNISKLAKQLDISRQRLYEMLYLLEEARLIYNFRSGARGISVMNKPEKIFLRNTSLIMALAEGKPDRGNLRETFFLSQLNNAGHEITYPDKGDFKVNNDYLFEVGGKHKSRKQIEGVTKAFIASDDIIYGHKNKIPLWLFGFMY